MGEQGSGGSDNETIFNIETTSLKYGEGASEETGWELKWMGVSRVMLVTDPGIVDAGIAPRIRELIEAEGIEVEVFDRAYVEPTAESFQEAADFAAEGEFDGFVAVGGGTSIDTAKVADLISTHSGEIMDYVNPPIGGGKQPPSPLKPLVAVPTTAGTGAEAMPVAILDIPDQRVKTGIASEYLRASRGIVDPLLTMSMPPEVTSATGLDVVCHATETYTSKPYKERQKPSPRTNGLPTRGRTPSPTCGRPGRLSTGGSISGGPSRTVKT